MRTYDEIRELLSQKFALERKRLKSFGTSTDAFQMANVMVRFVQALMSESRHRELKRLDKLLAEHPTVSKLESFIQERLKATKAMAKALQHTAESTEKARPWQRKAVKVVETKEKKHKHKHHKHGKHGKKK